MEESAEKRRERLRAMREEASLARNGDGRVDATPNATCLPSLGEVQQQRAPASPSPRFEFYTDPLAAFSGSSQKKKPKNAVGSPFDGGTSSSLSPFGGGAPSSPVLRSPLPFRQPNFNPNSGPPNPNLHFPGAQGRPTIPSGRFNSPNVSDVNPSVMSPGGYTTPYSNPGQSGHGVHPAFGSPQPYHHNGSGSGASFLTNSNQYNGSGSGGSSMNPTPPNYTPPSMNSTPPNGSGSWSFSNSISGWRALGSNDVRNSGQSRGNNCSWGSYNRSPGGGRSGGRGFERSLIHATVSAITNPERFAKRSMLLDPWKDLVPIRVDSVAYCLDSCAVSSSHNWLPESIKKQMKAPEMKSVPVSASGPSLAESLAASFADAVSGEGPAFISDSCCGYPYE